MPVHQWADIAGDFTDGLVLGNGASIAFDERFGYTSLRERAQTDGLIDADVKSVFDHLATVDFELVLRMLWHASKINEALGIDEPRTAAAYARVRHALIQVVRTIHVEHEQVVDRLRLAANFMKHFSTVASLNYDVLVYWAILVGNTEGNQHIFKDCFVDNHRFRQSWNKLREPIPPATKTTIIGYPHGNLAIAADLIGDERKLVVAGANLLETIYDGWSSGNYSPVFVSEGTTEQKLASIRRSPYLVTMYGELLPYMGQSIAIFGWSIGENDHHLLDAICSGSALRFAIAIDPARPHLVQEMVRVTALIRERQAAANVQFFDRASPGCWLVPP
ncbi:MAG: DUF4917 family protein [Gammaproteobacteria bacterium]|nr:DUF4917 family protein [Gammaproteobacteria bacterium]MDH5651319.1 DUF4917 family protein [Gammaproteobacteria bacterium]